MHALEEGTTWTDEVNEDIGDLYGRGMWLKTLAHSKHLHVEEDWKLFAQQRQWKRLENKVTQTTGLYKELNPGGLMNGTASYIRYNPRDSEAIRQIFKIRSGSSSLRADKEARHLSNTSTCRLCGVLDETARHVIDQCPALRSTRRNIRKRMDKQDGTYGELLSDIILANLTTEMRILRSGVKNLDRVDRIRKKAIRKIMLYFPDE